MNDSKSYNPLQAFWKKKSKNIQNFPDTVNEDILKSEKLLV